MSGVSITSTHRVLLEALVEGEYRSSIGFNPGIGQWGNEAVARQFYGACGSDGCQDAEIYSFLDYFQSPLAGTLDKDYRQVLRIRQTAQDPSYPGYQQYVDQLNDAVEQILIPEPSAWLFGPLNGRPYGYGTRGLYSPVPVGQADLAYWANLCGFAATTRSDAGVGQMFIGTIPETDKAFGGPCSWN